MADPRTVTFGSFRVDLRDERLWHGADAVRLTNKAFGVLQYLVEHPAQLVTKEALLESVWSRPYVSDAALAVCIRELRRALADDAKTPRFIETVRGRGYRFIAPIAPADSSSAFSHAHLPQRSVSTPRSAAQFLPADLVAPAGRESELAQLHGWLATALQGDRRVGFISGEAGIGKTTLVDAFVAQAQELADLWIGHGQCIDHYGAGEAYLPVLEALARLCRGVDGDDLVSLLRQHAPSWLLQMPALLSADELQTLQRTAAGTTRERMLRELAEAVEVLTARRPMLLVFEDLHWSDTSTLEWLAYVTRRRDPARLLVLVTYRPVEVIVHEHPLHTILQELRGHDQSAESVLDYLSQNAIAAYLAQQSVGMPAPEDLVRAIHERSSGNPLFVVALLDTLMSHGVVSVDAHGWRIAEELETVAATVPESLRQLIDGQLDQLDTEVLGLLEAASVAGAQFSAAAVAAGISGDTESIDAQLATLSRRGQFVRALGTIAWPDGTLAGHYGFIHAVYQEVLSSRVPVGRRSRLHRQIGARLETAYGVRAREIAAELAAHFVQGSDASRAARYLMFAGENAAQRSACQEAITHFNLALENLQALPDTPERAQRELPLQYGLGGALIAANGFAWPQTGQAFVRARELCAQLGNTAQVSTVLYGVCLFHLDRGEMTLAREIAEGALPAAEDDITVQLVGHRLVGTCQYFQGELVAARENLEVALGLYDATEHGSLTSVYATDVRVATLCWLSRVLCLLGYAEIARARNHEALALARELDHPHSLAFALRDSCFIPQFYRDVTGVQEQAAEVISLATDNDFSFELAEGRIHRGWALAQVGQTEQGITEMREGISSYRATGSEFQIPYLTTLLASGCCKAGRYEQGLELLSDALDQSEHTQELWFEAELHRLCGELICVRSRDQIDGAENCFQQALDISRRQQARSLELRAAISLSRLWRQQGKGAQAADLLAAVCGWFGDGFETADLQEAGALLRNVS